MEADGLKIIKMTKILSYRRCRLEIEPGRYLVAESGYLLTELRAVKQMGPENLFYLVDAGFNNLARRVCRCRCPCPCPCCCCCPCSCCRAVAAAAAAAAAA